MHQQLNGKHRPGSLSLLRAHAYSKMAFPLLSRFCSVDPLIVYYHMISDEHVPHVENLYRFRRVSEFAKDIDFLLKHFRPLSLQDFNACVKAGRTPPPRSFLVTFDDGLRECGEIAASILQAKGIPATFFVCSAFTDNKELGYDSKKSLLIGALKGPNANKNICTQVAKILKDAGMDGATLTESLVRVTYAQRAMLDKVAEVINVSFSEYLRTTQPYLTSQQLQDLLKAGHAVGAHSIDHPRFRDVPISEQLRQALESIRFVKQHFALPYGAFAFPSSDAEVSAAFFRELFQTGEVDLCFGNHGLLDEPCPRVFQRVSMEKTWMTAAGVLGFALARRFVKKATGKGLVKRGTEAGLCPNN